MRDTNRGMVNLPYGSTIYLSGPMTDEFCFNFENFFHWAYVFRQSGYQVINPAEIDCLKMFDGWKYEPCMWEEVIFEDCKLITDSADAIFVLKGWEDSRGVARELCAAQMAGKPVYWEEDRL